MDEKLYIIEVGLALNDQSWVTDYVEILLDPEDPNINDTAQLLAADAAKMKFKGIVGAFLYHWSPDKYEEWESD